MQSGSSIAADCIELSAADSLCSASFQIGFVHFEETESLDSA